MTVKLFTKIASLWGSFAINILWPPKNVFAQLELLSWEPLKGFPALIVVHFQAASSVRNQQVTLILQLNKHSSLLTCTYGNTHTHTHTSLPELYNPTLKKSLQSHTSVFHNKEKLLTPLKEMKHWSEYKWNCLHSVVWHVTYHWARQKVTKPPVSKNGLRICGVQHYIQQNF